MNSPQAPVLHGEPVPAAANLELKARMLMVFMVLLMLGSAAYLLYARGAFERTQELVLVADDSEGVVVGMDMTFSGFPIGRVRRIELAGDGKARIVVDVASKDAHWLRTSSVFTLVKGLVGGPNIRAYSGILSDPPLPGGAVRNVLQGDASAEIPKVIAAAKDLLENLNTLTGASGPAGGTLANLQTLTRRLNEPGGALAVLLGSEAEAENDRDPGPRQCTPGQARRRRRQGRYPGIRRQGRDARDTRHRGAAQCDARRGARQLETGRCDPGRCAGGCLQRQGCDH